MKNGLLKAALIAAAGIIPSTAFALDITVQIKNTTSQMISLMYSSCSGAPCPSNMPYMVPPYSTSAPFKMSDTNGGPLQMIVRYGNGANIGQFMAWNMQFGPGGQCASPFSSANKNWGNPTVNASGKPTSYCGYKVLFQYGP